MFIITNTTHAEEYTPSVAKSYKEAYEWMLECTVGNLAAGFDHYDEWVDNMTNEEIIEWAKKNIDGFDFDVDHSFIPYDDDEYNLMHIYDVNDL